MADAILSEQRSRLFEAQGIIECVRYALVSKMEGLDETAVDNALSVASRLIDNAASALEGR